MIETTLKTIGILEQEYNLYQSIYKLSQEKQEIIIKEDLKRLEGIIKEEEKLLEKVVQLETNRKKIIGDKTISQLIKKSKQPYQGKLKELQEKITLLLEELKDINKLNGDLINNSLQLTNMTLNIFTNNVKQNNYGKKGSTYNNKNQKLFINHKA